MRNTVLRTIEYANWKYSYEYPALVANDYIVFISPPGPTKGRGWKGHADLLGNLLEIESNLTYNNAANAANQLGDGTYETSAFQSRTTWSGNGSWEVHDYGAGGGSYSLLNKYGKQASGARTRSNVCAGSFRVDSRP